ncbi:ABC transporter permease [Zhengella mangrovi]|uniref:ABC transporter permease n=1 Tax=Zhengella mangrovi TaxID=1982044 RepID=UPI0013FE46A6|nr:iron ABC transporter permease [Zhengella mangrovi]
MATAAARQSSSREIAQRARAVPGALLWLIVGLGPILALLAAIPASEGMADALMPSLRRASLFMTSIALAFSVAVFTVTVSALAARSLRRRSGRASALLYWAPLAMIAVPPYVHANAWMSAGAGIDALLGRTAATGLSAPDAVAAFWVQSMAFLPAAYGFVLLGMARMDPMLVDAGRIHADDWRVFRRIELPMMAPSVIVGGGLAAILSLTDFSTPALFQLPSYAMDVFVTYGSGADSGAVFLLALPMVLTGIAIIAALLGRIETGTRLPDTPPYTAIACNTPPAWFRSLETVALFVLAMQSAIPVVALLQATGSPAVFAQTVAAASRDIVSSMGSAGISALFAILLGLLLFRHLENRFVMLLCLLPLAMPGTLTGIGLIHLWNNDATSAVYGGPAMPVLASLARFAPIGILLFHAHHRTISRDLIDAAQMFRGNGAATWWWIYLPLYWRAAAGVFLIVFALSLGELAATILIAPPGQGALSIRIFNLLHYGSTAAVASLSLLMLLLAMAAAIVLLALFNTRGAARLAGRTA